MLKPRYSKISDWSKIRKAEFIGCYKEYDVWTFVEYLQPGQIPDVKPGSLVAINTRNIGVENPDSDVWRVRDKSNNGAKLSDEEIADIEQMVFLYTGYKPEYLGE